MNLKGQPLRIGTIRDQFAYVLYPLTRLSIAQTL
nr:MAG TPA: hypothetical protein [Caudoviricetes sp.]